MIRPVLALPLLALLAACAAPQSAERRAAPAEARVIADQSPLTRLEVQEAQALLNRLGFGGGEPDGVVGPRSRAAAESFQLDAGAPATGAFDRGLLLMLRASAEEAGVATAAAPAPVSN